MSHVEIGGVRYACPFASLFHPLSAIEFSELRTSVAQQERILQPVIVCTTPTHGRTLIDGINRERAARDLGVPLPLNDLGNLTDERAEIIARDSNDRRRHLTPDQVVESRRFRDAMILRLKNDEGLSTRTIAEKAGASVGTVSTVLSKIGSGVQSRTPGDESEDDEPGESFSRGRDGKKYRQAPRAAARPSQAAVARPRYSLDVRFTGTVEEFLTQINDAVAGTPADTQLSFRLIVE